MRILTILPGLFSLCILIGCNESNNEQEASKLAGSSYNQRSIMVLPLGSIDKGKINEAVSALKKYGGNVTLLPSQKLPAHAFYSPRNRYRADSLIRWMARMAGPNEVYVGLTVSDISTIKGDVTDFGVMGLGFKPGKACVISSFRLKDKSNFYKVVLHEAAHTAGLSHCPEETCFLRDAKGGDPTGMEKGFCGSCSSLLKKQGWSLK